MSKRRNNPRAARRPRGLSPSLGPGPDVDDAAVPQSAPRVKEGHRFSDVVTLLEIRAPEEGGVREVGLPDDRSLSPPSPPQARREWDHPVARWATSALVVVVLTVLVVALFVGILRLG